MVVVGVAVGVVVVVVGVAVADADGVVAIVVGVGDAIVVGVGDAVVVGVGVVMNERTCIVPNCDRDDHVARGMCSLHYQRWRHRGRPDDLNDIAEPVHTFVSAWCVCTDPDQQPIVMFGWLRLVDVTECTHCHRPPIAA